MTITKTERFNTVALFFVGIFLLPIVTFAHERQSFEIGDKTYVMVIGSLNEPIVVDDKTGLDLKVYNANPSDVGNTTAEGVTPAEGLEDSLELIVSAGDESKRMPISTVYRQPGAYKSLFYPTRSTTLTYTLIGEINGQAVKLAFTCMPGDHVMHGSEENKERVAMGAGVTRVFQAGSFTCPADKSDLGFPDSAPSLYELKTGDAPAAIDVHAGHEGSSRLEMWWHEQNHEMLIALAALLIALYSLILNLRRKGS